MSDVGELLGKGVEALLDDAGVGNGDGDFEGDSDCFELLGRENEEFGVFFPDLEVREIGEFFLQVVLPVVADHGGVPGALYFRVLDSSEHSVSRSAAAIWNVEVLSGFEVAHEDEDVSIVAALSLNEVGAGKRQAEEFGINQGVWSLLAGRLIAEVLTLFLVMKRLVWVDGKGVVQ